MQISVKDNRDYIVYTDGGCLQNPGGRGAYGAVVIDCSTGEITELSEAYRNTTNNRMEIMAVIAALEFVKAGNVALFSDSQYVLNTLSGEYKKRKNLDLWKRLEKAAQSISMDLNWVRGHDGDELNERCDAMCTEAMKDDSSCKEDTGYAGPIQNHNTDQKKNSYETGIELPEEFSTEQIITLPSREYAERFHVTKRCADSIQKFKRTKTHSFRSYMELRTFGLDKWSRMGREELLEETELPELVWKTVTDHVNEETDAVACLRWYRRGLPLYDSIRKTLVSAEIRENCLTQK